MIQEAYKSEVMKSIEVYRATTSAPTSTVTPVPPLGGPTLAGPEPQQARKPVAAPKRKTCDRWMIMTFREDTDIGA
jgi:hypothetical protein